MSLALSLCQYVLRPKRGLAQVSPGLAWLRPGLAEPRSASIAGLHQHNRKGKIVMIKTRRYKRLVFGFVFCTWNWYDFWRRSWGLPCISWTPRFQRTSKKCRLLVYYLTDILSIRSASQGILFLLNAVYHFRDSLIRTSGLLVWSCCPTPRFFTRPWRLVPWMLFSAYIPISMWYCRCAHDSLVQSVNSPVGGSLHPFGRRTSNYANLVRVKLFHAYGNASGGAI